MTKRSSDHEIQQAFDTQMNRDKLLQCMRCGFCLSTCPTYIASGFKESHSPRGRIALMLAVANGQKEPDEDSTGQLRPVWIVVPVKQYVRQGFNMGS